MKALIIAAALIAVGAASASAQSPWVRGQHPYAQRHHNVCQDKAQRLYAFESRALADRQLSFQERRVIRTLRRDLDRTCGRYRWRG